MTEEKPLYTIMTPKIMPIHEHNWSPRRGSQDHPCVKDLGELEIGIQTKGYEDFAGDSNLLIGLGFLGKLTNNSNTGYKLYITNVIDALASKGIKMIKPMTISPDELGGLDWNISKNLEQEQMLIPEDSIMFKNPDDTYNLRFSSYKKKQTHDAEATTSGLERFLPE